MYFITSHHCTVSNPEDCSKLFILYSLANLFNWTQSWLLWENSATTAINSWRLLAHIYSPLYSFIQLSELEQCRVKQFAQGFTQQHRIRIWVVLVEILLLYLWATAQSWHWIQQCRQRYPTLLTLDPAVQTMISYITDTWSSSADNDILYYWH